MARKRLTREQQKAQTRKRLIESAKKVVARRGYHGASLEEVAEEAGYSRGAVYSNFENKEDLFFACIDEILEKWESDLRQVFETDEDPLKQAYEAGKIFDEVFGENLEWFVAFIEFCCKVAKMPKLRKKVATRLTAMNQVSGKIVEAYAEELGLPMPAPAEQLSFVSQSITVGFALRKLVDPENFPVEVHQSIQANYYAGVLALGREMKASKSESGDGKS